jgi:hypothetical protein
MGGETVSIKACDMEGGKPLTKKRVLRPEENCSAPSVCYTFRKPSRPKRVLGIAYRDLCRQLAELAEAVWKATGSLKLVVAKILETYGKSSLRPTTMSHPLETP